MSYAIGIDLGGTQIKMACVDVDGVVVDRSIADTDDDASAAWTSSESVVRPSNPDSS